MFFIWGTFKFLTYKILFKTFKISKINLYTYKFGDKINSKPGLTFHLSSKKILRFKSNRFPLFVSGKGTELEYQYMHNKTLMTLILKNKTSLFWKEKIPKELWSRQKKSYYLSLSHIHMICKPQRFGSTDLELISLSQLQDYMLTKLNGVNYLLL